jgi:ATP-dependent DNA helicase RecQ
LARGGLSVVVSPLIALMKDQVDGLVDLGVRATVHHSSLARDVAERRSDAVRRGEVELLYVAPERFTPSFLGWLARIDVRLLAVDEAHCVSQWGHDFRPEYLKLGKVREALRKPPTLALTATATPEVQDDIVTSLGIGGCRRFVQGFDRENLVLEVHGVEGPLEKDKVLPGLVVPGPTLVYVATRKNAERSYAALRAAGVRVGLYHAGLPPEERTKVQDAFMDGHLPVVVATNAFGMGIDKRDIRTIVHADMPGTVEAYYQEIGRAGRDGRSSRAVLLYGPGDRRIHEFFIDNAHPPAEWVHLVWDWLVARNENPVFASLVTIAEALPPEGGDRGAGSCVNILVREGRARRIAPSDRSAWLRVLEAPKEPPQGVRGRVWAHLEERGIGVGDSLQLHPDVWCHELGLEREQLTAAFRGLEDRGVLRYRAAERVGGVELHDPTLPLKVDDRRMRVRRGREYTKLDRMEAYTAARCRRRYVVEYFGETAPFEACGTCDVCREGRPAGDDPRPLTPDEEQVVLKVLSCVARMERHTSRTGFSIDLVSKVAVGSRDKRVSQWGFETLTTFGVLAPEGGPVWTSGEVADVLAALVEAGALASSYTTRTLDGRQVTYREIALNDQGWQVLRRTAAEFVMVFPHAARLRRRPVKADSLAASGVPGDLLARLRDVRRQLADERNVPAYVVAPNKTLEDMARVQPTTRRAMLEVHGMGPTRWQIYGQAFLDAIKSWQT